MLTSSDIANNLTTTTTGKVLDATQGKALKDLIGDAITYINQQVVIKITNDTTTLNGALAELGETMATNISAKGVTASASDGLTTLAGKISQIQTGGGGGCTRMVTGTFTTGSTRASTGTVTINYTGTGYPIAVMIYIDGGAYNPDKTWYNTLAQYDADSFMMTKAQMSSTPTFVASASVPANQGVVSATYKSNASTATTHSRNGSQSAVFFNSSDATTGYNCVRFKGNTKTLSYYIGNSASNRVGLAPSQTYHYIIIYSS